MRAYVRPVPWVGRAIHRVADALERYKPDGVELVTALQDAEFQLLHVIGPGCPSYLHAPNYAVFQYCFLTAGIYDYPGLWRNARAVFSYYDLPTQSGQAMDNFVQVPMGYDPAVFYPAGGTPKQYLATVTGYISKTEYIRQVYDAARILGGRVAHVGSNFAWGDGYYNFENITDELMRMLYQQSYFVAAMRESEGFELPALEGLACGTPVIMLDLPCYRKWFNGYSVHWVKHDEPIVPQIVEIMQNQTIRVVDAPEYNWQWIAEKCWQSILERY